VESWTEMAPLLIVSPNCVARAKAAPAQLREPEGRKTRWLPLLVIPLTVMVVMVLGKVEYAIRPGQHDGHVGSSEIPLAVECERSGRGWDYLITHDACLRRC